MGGLRHNTIILNWPEKWNKESSQESMDEDSDSLNVSSFMRKSSIHIIFVKFFKKLFLSSILKEILRYANINDKALIITKGIDNWPTNSRTETQSGTIDLWWIINDGGLLLLIVFLLKNHKIWQKCKLRLFTVARLDENSIQMKNDLLQYMYFLRIEAEVDVIEMVSIIKTKLIS